MGLEEITEKEIDEKSYMSADAILRAIDSGRIFINPFKEENLCGAQYDVTLGRYYYTENRERVHSGDIPIFNPYDPEHVHKVWGGPEDYKTAEKAKDWRMRNSNYPLVNIDDEDEIIPVHPGATILAHTVEFIGGSDDTITTMMKARSSLGRNFFEVCKCAGLGDIGYNNRWTMEITNNSQDHKGVLVVNRRVAQIVFFETEGISEMRRRYPEKGGKYQTTSDVDKMINEWNPSSMLPKMYNDREVLELQKRLRGE